MDVMSTERGVASGMHVPLLPHPSPLISAQYPPLPILMLE